MDKKTVLRKKKIAVVSKRRNVMDFFRLEGESCNCTVSVMPTLPLSMPEYDVIILDDDGSFDIQLLSDNVYRIIPDNEEQGINTLSWPVSVFRVREIFEGYIVEDISKIKGAEDSVLYLKDDGAKFVIYRNMRIDLTESEWNVLMRLAKACGEAVSREALRELFGAIDGNITDVYICHLRRKLEEPFGEKIIRTVRGKGYMLSVAAKFE